MVPALIASVDRLPLTPNGKIDRARLPAAFSAPPPSQARPPASDTERLLFEVWAQLLGHANFGVDDNFFDLGGHSLLAARVRTRLAERAGLDLPLRTLFEAPTIAALAARADALPGGSAPLPAIPAVARDQDLPLSFGQQRLWVLHQLDPGSAAYNIPLALSLQGDLVPGALRHAFHQLVLRHESLRTRFAVRDGAPVQIIEPPGEWVFPVEDLSLLAASEHRDELAHRVQREAETPFDLLAGPLLRVQLLRLDPREHLLIITLHHIIADGWSGAVLVQELSELYAAHLEHRAPRLQPLPIQYPDYVAWQRALIEGEVGQRQLAYWRTQLADAPALELPTDRPRPAVQSHRGASVPFQLSAELTAELKRLAQQHDATLFMTVFGAFCGLLHRYTGQTDLCVGVPVANRPRPELEGLIGFFVNTLVLRADLSGRPSFVSLLARVRETALAAFAHQDLPFDTVVEQLNPVRDLSRSPIFQVMFALQNAPSFDLQLPGVSASVVPAQTSAAKFDLTVFLSETDQGLAGSFEYATDLLDEATVRRMAGHFERLLRSITAAPDRPVDQVPLLADGERSRQLGEWNQTQVDVRSPALHHRIAERARVSPESPAVRFGSTVVTYGELLERAQALAAALSARGVGAESVVAVSIDRSIEMVVACLAVLMTGGAYLPLDGAYPAERIEFILRGSGAAAVLVKGVPGPALSGAGLPVLDVADPHWQAVGHLEPGGAAVDPEQLAYVIYTSGSTGTPKGVAVNQRGLTNYVDWACGAYRLDPSTHSLVHSSLGFDLTITSLWCPLAAGGTVELLDPEQPVDALLDAFRGATGPRFIKITPAHLSILTSSVPAASLPGRPHTLVIGGEALTGAAVSPWIAGGGRARLVNEYGPTETGVGCCVFDVDQAACALPDLPIGRAIQNTSLYVLDSRLEPVPLGAIGDLYIGGEGVARGYLGRPDLTAQQFIPDPFGGPGRRLYRTGDRAKQLADGTLVFLGRNDEQVKLRGFRIELTEIEAVLRDSPNVRDAAVAVVREPDRDAVLRAFVVPGLHAPSDSDLRELLRARVPEYMIPTSFVFLPVLPLTVNGKVDRRALARSTVRSEPAPRGRREPATDTQRELARLWEQLLRVAPGADDDFFELGGNSMTALRLASAVESRFGRTLRLADIFGARTLAALAQVVEAKVAQPGASLVPLLAASPGRASVYFVHPIGGSIDVYWPLARHLNAEKGFGSFGLQAPEPCTEVTEMARRYLDELAAARPTGPVVLCGWSFGAVVAYEMARQLVEAGRPPAQIVCIEPARLGDGPSADDADLLQELATTHGLASDALAIQERVNPNGSIQDRLEALVKRAQSEGRLAADISMRQLRQRFEVFAANRRALQSYRPTALLDIPAAMVWAAERPESDRSPWHALLRAGQEISLPGDHYQVMQPPLVHQVADLFDLRT